MPASLMCWLGEPERRRGRGAGSELPRVETPGAGKGQGGGQRGASELLPSPLASEASPGGGRAAWGRHLWEGVTSGSGGL